jgi:hypothetical protein
VFRETCMLAGGGTLYAARLPAPLIEAVSTRAGRPGLLPSLLGFDGNLNAAATYWLAGFTAVVRHDPPGRVTVRLCQRIMVTVPQSACRQVPQS